MDIDELAHEIYEDLNASIDVVALQQYSIVLQMRCDDWAGGDRVRRFELRCEGAREWNVSVGSIDSLWWKRHHPLLLEYDSPCEYLHHETAPRTSHDDVLAAILKAHRKFFGHDADRRARGISGPVEGAQSGLIAAGPSAWIDAIQRAIGDRMGTYRTDGPPRQSDFRILTAGDQFVICHGVTVTEVAPASAEP